MCSPHISGLGPDLSFLVGKEPTEVTGSAPAQEICLCSPSIHLFSLVLLFFLFLISTGCEYLVYDLGHNLISHFLAQIVPAWAMGCSFGVLLHQAVMSSSGEGCVCARSRPLLSGTTRCSGLFLYIPCSRSLEAAISLRNPSSSYCNVGSENRVSVVLAVLMSDNGKEMLVVYQMAEIL